MKLITNLALLFAVATAIATAQVSPTHPFPDDPEELNRVTCGQNADYDCIWLVNHQIDLPVFVDPKMNYKTVTRANGERIVVTGPGAKGSITARCLNNPALSSQLDFSFDLASGNQVNHVRGIMNAQFASNWPQVVSKEGPQILSSVKGDDLRVYCTRTA